MGNHYSDRDESYLWTDSDEEDDDDESAVGSVAFTVLLRVSRSKVKLWLALPPLNQTAGDVMSKTLPRMHCSQQFWFSASLPRNKELMHCWTEQLACSEKFYCNSIFYLRLMRHCETRRNLANQNLCEFTINQSIDRSISVSSSIRNCRNQPIQILRDTIDH